MCQVCGEIFAQSQPFKDESEAVRSDVLAKRLYNHLCAIRRPETRKAETYAEFAIR